MIRTFISSLIWRLAQRTPQYAQLEARYTHEIKWHEAQTNGLARMHGRLMADMTAQQRANRVKRRKLAGLRLARRNAAVQWRIANDLNVVHCAFVDQLERDHPELAATIAAHNQRRVEALHPIIAANL